MAHGHYSPQFKTDSVPEVLHGEKELGEIAAHYNAYRAPAHAADEHLTKSKRAGKCAALPEN